MQSRLSKISSVAVHLNLHDQQIDNIQKIVAQLAGKSGCAACGRIARFDLHFADQPAVELGRLGVQSIVETQIG